MKKYRFTIDFIDKGNHVFPVFINLEAEGWWAISSNEQFSGDLADVAIVRHYLNRAYCMYGYLFNPERYIPSRLYEALLGNRDWRIIVDGDVPCNPFPNQELPPDTVA